MTKWFWKIYNWENEFLLWKIIKRISKFLKNIYFLTFSKVQKHAYRFVISKIDILNQFLLRKNVKNTILDWSKTFFLNIYFRSGANNNENYQTVDNPNLTPSKYSEVEQGAAGETFDKNMLKSFTKNKAFKTRHKLKAHTSKIVSSFKPPAMTCMLAKEFRVSK